MGGASASNGERFNLKHIWRQKQILKIIYTTVLSLISKSLWMSYFRERLNFISNNPSKYRFQLNIGIPSLTKCCNQHDRCYETCGKSKNDCDEAFQSCLSKICRDVQKTLGLAQHVQGKADFMPWGWACVSIRFTDRNLSLSITLSVVTQSYQFPEMILSSKMIYSHGSKKW